MNYQIYLGTAGLTSQCLPHILYHQAGEQSNITIQILKLKYSKFQEKKTYFMVVLIFDILSREAAAGYWPKIKI